jgi:hypothetical protein
VATHELGHALGLSHNSIKGSIMRAGYQSNLAVKLHEDDIAGIQVSCNDCRDSQLKFVLTCIYIVYRHMPKKYKLFTPTNYSNTVFLFLTWCTYISRRHSTELKQCPKMKVPKSVEIPSSIRYSIPPKAKSTLSKVRSSRRFSRNCN